MTHFGGKPASPLRLIILQLGRSAHIVHIQKTAVHFSFNSTAFT
jgi:hypothetical protein